MDIPINYFALVLAAIAAVGIGALWYSPFLFGRVWMAAAGITPEKMAARRKQMIPSVIGSFICQLITAYVLVHLAAAFEALDVFGALQFAFWAWLGFTAVTMLQAVLWEGKSTAYFVINAGYNLVSFGVMAVILILWR